MGEKKLYQPRWQRIGDIGLIEPLTLLKIKQITGSKIRIDKLTGYRLITLFSSIFPIVGSSINRASGLNEPFEVSTSVAVISFLMFLASWSPRFKSATLVEWGITAWTLLIGAFNGLNIYLNEANSTYMIPALALVVISAWLHSNVRAMGFSLLSLYILNIGPAVVVADFENTNVAFLQIGATFFFIIIAVSRVRSIRVQSDLDTKNALLEVRTKELVDQNQELEKFSYVLSHDLKSPVRGIKSLITFSLEDLDDAGIEIPQDIKDNFGLISQRAEKLERLIDGVLAYTKAGRKKEKMQISIREGLKNALDQIEIPSNFHVFISGEDAQLLFNPIELYQVFQNLISNAIKYNDKQKGRLEIKISPQPHNIKLSFKDTGKGIEGAYIHKVFNLFETLHVQNSYENTGIGLAIVKRIVDLNDGNITVTSEKGKWTEFILEFSKPEDEPKGMP